MNKKTTNKKSTFIIAEMAWSHDCSLKKAKKIIKGAAEAGADAVSFHITHMADYMVKDYGLTTGQVVKKGKKKISMYDYLDKLNLKDKDWKVLFPFAKKLGLTVIVMPNDNKSLELCRRLNPHMYVLAAACFEDKDFIVKVAKEKKPVILRIGGANISEIKMATNLIRKQGVKKIILLHGIQSYPTKIEDTNLNLIPYFKKIFKLPVGLADHIDAESDMAQIVPLMAIAKGATVVEKHLTHNRALKGVDYIAAFNPGEFKKMVANVRGAEIVLGVSKFKGLFEAELNYRKVARKRMVADQDIKKGEKITKNKITFKRANEGFYPADLNKIIGRVAKVEIKKDESILRNKIK